MLIRKERIARTEGRIHVDGKGTLRIRSVLALSQSIAGRVSRVGAGMLFADYGESLVRLHPDVDIKRNMVAARGIHTNTIGGQRA